VNSLRAILYRSVVQARERASRCLFSGSRPRTPARERSHAPPLPTAAQQASETHSRHRQVTQSMRITASFEETAYNLKLRLECAPVRLA
jgi:hypothetical protein